MFCLADKFALTDSDSRVNIFIAMPGERSANPSICANFSGFATSSRIISGVFYPQADRESDRIYFYKDGYERIKVPTENWNHWNSESWWYETGAGDLIIFPSNLTHMVQTKQGDGTRISISFNTFVKGYIGSDESLTGLHLGEE